MFHRLANLSPSSVYRSPMRSLIFLSLFVQATAYAQPSFCFALAEHPQQARPLQHRATVVQHFRERIPYVGVSGTWLGPVQELTLEGGSLFGDSTEQWVVYSPVEGMAESYALVIHRKDTMHIDLPEDPKPLIDRAWRRWDRDTPEVIFFRAGCYAMEELVAGPWPVAAANNLTTRLIGEDNAAYARLLADQEEYYRNQPPPSPPRAPYIPPPPMTEEQWAAFWAEQPPLRKAGIDRVNADTVWVKITGRVALNGGCASAMPLFGLEMLSDTGWVERIPFELIQMDCGMPWADWEDHVVVMPMRYWVASHSRTADKDLAPGSYRLLFQGGNMKQVRTAAFEVR